MIISDLNYLEVINEAGIVGGKAAWMVQRQTGNVAKKAVENPAVNDQRNVGAGSPVEQIVNK